MTETIPELGPWARPLFQPGGGDAWLLYVVFGAFERELVVSRERYRSRGIPEGLTVTRHDHASQTALLGPMLSGYLGRIVSEEQPELARAVRAAPDCLIVKGAVADPPSLEYLRDVIGFVTSALDAGGVGVLDPQAFGWWDPWTWRSRIFEPDAPAPRLHVTILSSNEMVQHDPEGAGATWLHTRGLRKFGRPDLSAHGVEPAALDGVVALFLRTIELLAYGATIEEGQLARATGVPEDARWHHAGDLDDPDFNNVHLDLRRAR